MSGFCNPFSAAESKITLILQKPSVFILWKWVRLCSCTNPSGSIDSFRHSKINKWQLLSHWFVWSVRDSQRSVRCVSSWKGFGVTTLTNKPCSIRSYMINVLHLHRLVEVVTWGVISTSCKIAKCPHSYTEEGCNLGIQYLAEEHHKMRDRTVDLHMTRLTSHLSHSCPRWL